MYDVSAIAAAAASNSTIGCFFDRESDFVRAFKVHAPFGEKTRQLDVFNSDDTIWQSMMDHMLLSRHRSASQERMLSPCVLYIL